MLMAWLNPRLWTYKLQKAWHFLQAWWAYWALTLSIQWTKKMSPNQEIWGVLLAEHLGDILAAEPLLRAWKAEAPKAKIYWIVRAPFAEVLAHHPLVDRVILEPSVLFSTMLDARSPFDRWIPLHLTGLRNDPYFKNRSLVHAQADAMGITYRNYLNQGSLLDLFARLSHTQVQDQQPQLYVPTQVPSNKPARPYWIIHRKSNNLSKDWQDAHWERLVLSIIQTFEVDVVEIGLNQGLELSQPHFHSLVGKTNLNQSIAWLQSAEFFIGIDSGPAHLANALHLPALLLFGHFADFNDYQVYSGAYANGDLALICRNSQGPAASLAYETVWDCLLQHHHLKEKHLTKV